MTCTVEITLHALSQRSPAESIGKGQKLIEAARPEGAEALSPGQRPGLSCSQTWRPVRAKALKLTLKFIKLLPLQVGCSKFESKIRYKKWCYFGAAKLLIFNTLIYEIVL